MNTAVTVEKLSFRYDKDEILSDVSLELPEKSLMVIIGPNGGGKSTFLKILLGLLPLQSGKITIFGNENVKDKGCIGYVPQDSDQIKNFPIDVMDTALMGFTSLHRQSLSKAVMRQKAKDALKLVGMENYMNYRLNELSTGQRQRVMLARALAPNPRILALDEPISGIDPSGQKIIMEALKSKLNECTIIFVSHDLSVIPSYATSVACINRSLYYHPAGEITTSLLKQTYGELGALTLVNHACDCGGNHA